jgi:hypothetical protein
VSLEWQEHMVAWSSAPADGHGRERARETDNETSRDEGQALGFCFLAQGGEVASMRGNHAAHAT